MEGWRDGWRDGWNRGISHWSIHPQLHTKRQRIRKHSRREIEYTEERKGTRRKRKKDSKQFETSDGFHHEASQNNPPETETDRKRKHVAMETISSIPLNGTSNLYIQSVCTNAASVLLGRDLLVGTLVVAVRGWQVVDTLNCCLNPHFQNAPFHSPLPNCRGNHVCRQGYKLRYNYW